VQSRFASLYSPINVSVEFRYEADNEATDMTPHQTLAVAIRLFAVWLAVVALRELVGGYIAGRERNDAYALTLVLIIGCVSVVFVVILWFFPKTIARGLLPSGGDVPAKPAMPEVWFGIGTSLIGLWLVASAIPGVFRNLWVMYIFRSESGDTSGLISGLIYLFAQIVVGIVLIVGADGIRRFVWWARHAGPD
jgi:hypothetical protein